MAEEEDEQMRGLEIRIYGLVQGIGFRPFVARLARQYGLAGWVLNESGSVYILVKGESSSLESFLTDLQQQKPAPARIIRLEKREVPPEWIPSGDFRIAESAASQEAQVFLPPDMAVCSHCRKEMENPADRRFAHPFISCMLCGPRYTIIDRVPYDRENTTMDEFPMCSLCRAEYTDAGDRRFHAQTISCHECGPRLIYREIKGEQADPVELWDGAALQKAVEALKAGKIVAIKGIGGYHLACSPFSDETVQALRELKGRETKPLALMFPDLAAVRQYCRVSKKEAEILDSMEKPIVLLRKLKNSQGLPISSLVCMDSLDYGVFLPYTPLQILISRETGPLIMTSANISGEPIIWDDAKIEALEHPALAGVLLNLRKIRTGVDDSVVRCLGKEQQMIRRARGYVPMPIWLPPAARPGRPARKEAVQLLACGGMLKNTFCLVKNNFAYLSQHLGDLSSAQAFAEYCSTIDRLGRLLEIEPELVACDLHPDYPTTHYARKIHPNPILVQHHHAHIASVMAEYGLEEEVLGVAFDGTGYGDDGNIWGGEFLVCSPAHYQRAGQLAYIPMLGGDSSIAECWKSAAAYLYQAGLEELISHPSWPTLRAALAAGYNCLPSSSVGRLFDAASSLLGICQQASYEGEGAIRLEQAAVTWMKDHGQEIPQLPYVIKGGPDRYILDALPLIRALAEGIAQGKDRGFLAAGFHYALSSAAAELCRQICREQGLKTVVLSGGVFQNMLLMQHLVAELRKSGLRVFYNTKVPPNDGGISLGQALIALRRGES